MSRNDKIKEILDERGIRYLLHFTQLANLPSIIQHGLKTKDELDDSAKCNDDQRLDNHTDSISKECIIQLITVVVHLIRFKGHTT